jgi:hypothetical protein
LHFDAFSELALMLFTERISADIVGFSGAGGILKRTLIGRIVILIQGIECTAW